MLDDLGLVAALNQWALEIGQSSGLKAEVSSGSTERRLPPEVETGLFRIAQEALENVLQHAAAHLVRIDVQVRDEWAEDDLVRRRRRLRFRRLGHSTRHPFRAGSYAGARPLVRRYSDNPLQTGGGDGRLCPCSFIRVRPPCLKSVF